MGAEAARAGWVDALMDPMRTIHTVRHLYPVQVTNRAIRLLTPRRRVMSRASDARLLARSAVPPARSGEAPFDGRSFSFLNRKIVWEGPDRWCPRGADALWLYNLHYFRFLWDVAPADAGRLIADWIGSNVDARTVAWDPYPISLRVREWIEWLLDHPDVDPALGRAMIDSIAEQTELLHRGLEFHLMGNHLLENAITLCWAGLSFVGGASDAWRREGAALLDQELARQVLSDGSHAERSPMYQAILAEGLLRLGEVAARAPHLDSRQIGESARRAGRRLVRSLACIVHPDGDYALLNDTALGIAPRLGALAERYGVSLRAQEGAWSLPEAGYGGHRSAEGSYVVFDSGPLGPDHQPGHGHADALSFECSHRGSRLITDTGVFTYTGGATREHDRSTAAHNTIEVDGRDQSELWGSFRCARRTSSHWMRVQTERNHIAISGGYRGPAKGGETLHHTRRIVAGKRGLSFSDRVDASGHHAAAVRVHFAPGVQLRRADRRWLLLDEGGTPLGCLASTHVSWHPSASVYHPEFGREQERTALVARFSFRDHASFMWHLVLR